jgi:hypothetical protein
MNTLAGFGRLVPDAGTAIDSDARMRPVIATTLAPAVERLFETAG